MRNARRVVALAALGCCMSVAMAQSPPAAPGPGAPALPQRPASMSASITTVQDLLALENAMAARLAQKQRVDAGLASPEAPAAAKAAVLVTPPVQVSVDAIFGLGEQLRAHLTVGGQPFSNVTVGSRVRTCEVVQIANRCVAMKPVRGVKNAPACPTACWTGIPPAPPAFAGGLPGIPGGVPGGPLPMPMPGGGGAQVQPQPVIVQAVPTPPPPGLASSGTPASMGAGGGLPQAAAAPAAGAPVQR